MTMPPPHPPPPEEEESGDPCLAAECQRLLEAVPAAAATSPAFRRHWPSISASLAALSSSLASPSFPPSAPLLSPLAAALRALLSVSGDAPRLGHLHTLSLLSSTAASLSHLAADARLLSAPPSTSDPASAGDALLSRLRLGSAASRAAALEDLASSAPTLHPPSAAAAAVSAVAALLDSAAGGCTGDLRELAVAALAALASSSSAAAVPSLLQESSAVVPHLCRALESATSSATAEHACAALLPLTSSSRDAAACVATRGGVAALLSACGRGTPAAQAAAAGVLRNVSSFPDLLPAFRNDDGGGGGDEEEPRAVPVLLRLVSLGTTRAQELALGCLQNLTAGEEEEGQRMRVEAFQEGALGCVRDYLDGVRDGDDEPGGLAPALGLLRNMAKFRYIAEIASGGGFVDYVAAALGSGRSATRTQAALALAELCSNATSKAGRQQEGVVAEEAVPRLVGMMEAKCAAAEREAAARALAAVMAAASGSRSGACCRKAFRKEERGVVNAVQMLEFSDGSGVAAERRFAVAVLQAVARSRRCRKQMVAAGACGFLQGLAAAEVEGAKRLAECLGKGKMLGVFPRT